MIARRPTSTRTRQTLRQAHRPRWVLLSLILVAPVALMLDIVSLGTSANGVLTGHLAVIGWGETGTALNRPHMTESIPSSPAGWAMLRGVGTEVASLVRGSASLGSSMPHVVGPSGGGRR